MTASLPPNLLALFEARPLVEYKPPISRKKPLPPGPIYSFTTLFEDPKDTDYSVFSPSETRDQRKKRIAEERKKRQDSAIAEILKDYDPNAPNENFTGDPHKTVFVSRINYETSDQKLKREFEVYGIVKKVRLIVDSKTGKSRGYAFVEFERQRDAKKAYKEADGKKIDGKRVLVDMEKGRTVPGWRPRRLGGGLGGTRIGGDDVNQKYSGREPPSRDIRGSSSGSGGSVSGSGSSSSGGGGGAGTRDSYRGSSTKDSYRSSRDSYRAPNRDSYRGSRDSYRRFDDREERDGERNRDRERDRDRDRERDRERDRDRDRDRERDRSYRSDR